MLWLKPFSTSYFCPFFMLRMLQSLGQIGNLNLSTMQTLFWVLKNVQPFSFFFLDICNLLKPITEKEKYVMLWSTGYIIIHNKSLFTILWYLPHLLWHWMRLYFH
jgi:hypothetical protein